MALGVASDDSGNVYITGSTSGPLPGAPESYAGNDDAYVVKADSSGILALRGEPGMSPVVRVHR